MIAGGGADDDNDSEEELEILECSGEPFVACSSGGDMELREPPLMCSCLSFSLWAASLAIDSFIWMRVS